ncbi:unnamed protein product [Gongylonema pulchrum]|uniref:HABP4_PAI-RBP1 domain-containing protein n=1 Tax=Gongylonema pulchrum TaxID=637853 RepID=A0A183EPM9_9BILA|nr:unnamed protein product [Gongylonema pulchrum]
MHNPGDGKGKGKGRWGQMEVDGSEEKQDGVGERRTTGSGLIMHNPGDGKDRGKGRWGRVEVDGSEEKQDEVDERRTTGSFGELRFCGSTAESTQSAAVFIPILPTYCK